MNLHPRLTLLAPLLWLAGCAVSPENVTIRPLPSVELQRFMGPWYVIANIPTVIEKGAHDAIETYRLDDDGTIATTFTFRKGGFDGPMKQYNPRGFVVPGTGNAIWGMRFIWPIKAEYVIAWVDTDYTETIIARSSLDYVWVMARTPTLPQDRYDALLARVRDLGYDMSKVQKVPQSAAGAPAATPAPSTESGSAVTPVDHDSLLARIDANDPDLVVLDVRTAEEFAAGHVPGARNISHDLLASRVGELDDARGRELVVYCRSGKRAALALDTLRAAGFTRLAHLEGDFLGWQAAQRPVATLDGAGLDRDD
ncbi:MAG: lipocalin family protein [Steroidobacteraceae bacterium]